MAATRSSAATLRYSVPILMDWRRCFIAVGCVLVACLAPQANAQLFANAVPVNDALGGVFTDEDTHPAIATDGEGVWMVVWQSKNAALGLGADWDILVAVSDDNGLTWSRGVVNSNAAVDVADDVRPDIATDRQGNWMVVWHSNLSSGDLGTDDDILFAVSQDNGASWTPPRALNSEATTDGATEDRFPKIATDGEGRWVAVWGAGGAFGFNRRVNLAYSDDLGETWSAQSPMRAPAVLITFLRPAIAYAGGIWSVVYSYLDTTSNAIGPDMVLHRSEDGDDWDGGIAVNDVVAPDPAQEPAPAIAGSPDGVWVVAWESGFDDGRGLGSDLDIVFTRSDDAGLTWSPLAHLNSSALNDAGADTRPDLATDGNGVWFCVWSSREDLQGTGTDPDIFFATSRDNGLTWSPPAPLNHTATTDDSLELDDRPRIATDGTGAWLAVWDGTGNLINPFGQDADIFAASAQFPDPFDVNHDNLVDAVDIQLVINGALGLDVSPYDTDLNKDGQTDAIDVQLIINEVLNR